MHIIAAKLNIKPEIKTDFVDFARTTLIPLSRLESGCISYSCYEDQAEANAFLFFEEWASREAIDEHFQTGHFKQLAERMPDFTTDKPVIKIYEVAGTEEL